MPATPVTVQEHQQLMVQLQHGQDGALKALYDQLAGVTYRVCLRMLVSPEDAEEVLQDTFLRLEVQAHRYAPARGTVQTFVLTIAHHLCLERMRARRARPQALDAPLDDRTVDPPAQSPHDPLNQALVDTALVTLPPTDRLLLEGMFFGGHTHAELTVRTGLPLGTVKSRLRRALLKLRERMTP
ncbi:sigma-70 family RNA polymerase sigma factor (plasmid) [Deinococcus taeanensis]|uniref:sigma-70 family RNA polymerase sigma factor n=1 Tax=Deinococcus taeanensis TaxID=2737050 RepID=UPI001CDBED0F|nr:sigma-70 family RNA polymerase sigma factor [Deinococcus taeanensis]UBV44384.1 sigma-70 family RNA polymerase sigma factor [Deinococcus taeanensis]